MTTQPTNPLIAARRNDSDRRRRKVLDALDRLRTAGDEITVSAVARTAVDRSFLYRHHDLRSQILTLAAEPEPNPSDTLTSRRSLLADLANLRAHNERLRHHNTKLSERLSEVLGEQVFHDAGLTRTDEIGTLRERVAELEKTPRPTPGPPGPRRRTRRRPRRQPRPDDTAQQPRPEQRAAVRNTCSAHNVSL